MSANGTQRRMFYAGRINRKAARIGSLDFAERRRIAMTIDALEQRGPQLADPKIVPADQFLQERLLRAHAEIEDGPRGAA